MIQLLPSQALSIPFTAENGTPDATPVVTVYAGVTLLGSASVSSAGGTQDYLAAYTLPGSGIDDYTLITMRVNYAVGSVNVPTGHLLIGEYVAYRRADAIETDALDIQSRLPATLVGGRMSASVGEMQAGAIAAIWNALTSGLTTVGSVGKWIIDNLNATVGSRSTYSGADTPGTATLLGLLTATRAGYLDNLNVGGPVASLADINALNQSASRRIILQTTVQLERPDSGSTVYTVEVRTFDGDGAPANADANPTLTAVGQTTGPLGGFIGAITSPSTGVYRWPYSVPSNAAIEPVRFDASATVGGSAFPMSFYSQVVDFVSATWTSSDATKLNAVFSKLPSKAFLAGTADSTGSVEASALVGNFPGTVGGVAGTIQTLDALNTSQNVQHSATQTSLSTLLSRIPATLFSGITNLGKWLGLLGGKTADPTTLAEYNATTAGATFTNVTDSLEAIRDRGDTAWSSGSISGQYVWTVNVSDGTVPIEGAIVTISKAGTIIDWKYADFDGAAPFSLNADSYLLSVTARGFTSIAGQALTVAATGSSDVTMVPQPVTPPPVSGMATVVGTAMRGADTVAGATIVVNFEDQKATVPAGIQLQMVASVVSETDGSYELILPWSESILYGSGIYRITATDPRTGQVCYQRRFTVPSEALVQIADCPSP